MRITKFLNSPHYIKCHHSIEVWVNDILRSDWFEADDTEGWMLNDEGVKENGHVEIFRPFGTEPERRE